MKIEKLKILFFVALLIVVLTNLNLYIIGPAHPKPSESKTDPINLIYEPFERLTPYFSKYSWPTDASYKITSSFAEFRQSHFHGGIDISTHLKEGFKVFAALDGYVAKIQILPNGYGKMLYLKHPDGYYTTYAHLKDFNDKIKNVVYREQLKKGTYFIDIDLDSMEVPVKQSEVIAYTGNTGAGPPHLHFEIRDENLNPVNPALFTNFRIKDYTPPLIKKIFIAAADNWSSVFDKSEYQIYKINSSNFKFNRPINIKGKIKLGIETKDYGNDYSAKTGVYRIEFFLNDSLIYQQQYDRIPAEYAQEILLQYDLKLLLENKGKFQKLYVENGNNLPIYNRLPYGSGIIDCSKLTDGLHDFKIVVSDFSNNKSVVNGKFLVDNHPTLKFLDIADSTLNLKCDNIHKITKIIIETINLNKSSVDSFSLNELKINNSIISIPFKEKNYRSIRISIINNNNRKTYSSLFKSKEINSKDVSLNYEITDDHIKCILTTSDNQIPNFKSILIEGNKNRIIDLVQVNENKYIGFIEPDPSHKSYRKIKLIKQKNETVLKETEDFLIYPIKANSSGTYTLENGNITISYDSNSVYNNFIITYDVVFQDGIKIYRFYPQDILLKKGIEIKFKANENFGHIYFLKKGKWIIQNWKNNSDSNYLTAYFTRTLNDVTILKDTNPPTINNLRVKNIGNKIHISYKFKDDLSGLDYDKFKMYINDELVIPEINEEKRIVQYVSENKILSKTKRINIEIADKAGNIQQIYREIK